MGKKETAPKLSKGAAKESKGPKTGGGTKPGKPVKKVQK